MPARAEQNKPWFLESLWPMHGAYAIIWTLQTLVSGPRVVEGDLENLKAERAKPPEDLVHMHRAELSDHDSALWHEVVALKESSHRIKKRGRRVKKIAAREHQKASVQYERCVDQHMKNGCSNRRRAGTAEKTDAVVQ